MSTIAQAPLRVLVIDDMQDILTITSAILQSLGAEAFTATSAAVGLDILKQQLAGGSTFNLVILDIRMPGTDGFSAAEQLRAAGYKGKMVAFTANATMQGKKKGVQAGIDGYFSKMVLNKDVLGALLDEVRRGS